MLLKDKYIRALVEVRSRDSSVGYATGYGAVQPGFVTRQGQKDCFFTPQRPDRFWSPPASYSIGRGSFHRGQSGQGVKLTTHLHLVTRSIVELYLRSSWRGALLAKHWGFTLLLLSSLKINRRSKWFGIYFMSRTQLEPFIEMARAT
jgi:hypothetical protein